MNRLPNLLLALGLFGVVLTPRYSHFIVPRAIQGDFTTGVILGIFLAVEVMGAAMMIRARRASGCRRLA